jgi:hypothetical protein
VEPGVSPHLAPDPSKPAVQNRERWAQIGIVVQFLALIRTLGEVFRLRYLRGAALQIADIQPFVVGAAIAAVLSLVAVVLYFGRRYSAVVAVAGLTVVVLLVYKLVFMT